MIETFKKKIPYEFIKFCLTGLICTILNYFVFYTFFKFVHVSYLISSGVGFFAGVAIGFPLNQKWTYKSGTPSSCEPISYLFVYLFSLAISLFFLKELVERLHMSPLIANMIVIAITTCINYLGTKYFVFKTKSRA